MLTLGVDLAAGDKRTAMATVEWLPDRAIVRNLVLDVSDARTDLRTIRRTTAPYPHPTECPGGNTAI